MNLKNKKDYFLLRFGFFSAGVQAAFQRNKIYYKKAEEMTEKDKKTQAGMKDFIFERLRKSIDSVGSTTIVDYIGNLQNDIMNVKEYKEILREGQITFGTLQKIVNLYLKYLWVAGRLGVKVPPHCPVDSQVLKAIKWQGVSWREMEKKDYERAIRGIANKTSEDGFQSIAEWELENWPFSK